VVHITAPASDGAILVLATNDVYTIQACFTSTLATTNIDLFSLYINGILQARRQGRNPALSPVHQRLRRRLPLVRLRLTGSLPGTNSIQLIFTNQVFVSDSRTIAVARPGDSDGDGMPDYAELIAGTNPFDANSVLRITTLDTGSQLIVWDSISNVNYQVLATTNLNYPLVPSAPSSPPAERHFLLRQRPDRLGSFIGFRCCRRAETSSFNAQASRKAVTQAGHQKKLNGLQKLHQSQR